jgi:hypothetical protein
MPTFSSSKDDSRTALARSLHHAALRQTATLRAASAAVTHAPTLDDCAAAVDRLREELAYLEDSANVYRELFDAELTERIAPAVAQLSLPVSWLDASIAQLVLCLASQVEVTHQLAGTAATGSIDTLLRRLGQEREHVDAARAALAELCAEAQDGSARASLARWLPVALETLDVVVRPAYLEALRRDTAGLGIALEAHNTLAA